MSILMPQPTGLRLVLVRDARIGGRRVGILSDDWFYCYPPTGELILVPRGYATDFASIPWWAKGVIEEMGNNIEAAVVHDWLYAVGESGRGEWADQVLRHALMEQGVNMVRRNAIYQAVRKGGGAAYGRPGEWDERFGDPETGLLGPSPFKRRVSGVVAKLDNCRAALEDPGELAKLREAYRSETWPPA